MGYPTKVQCIQRKDTSQYYINFPSPIAQAMDFAKGEIVEWTIHDKGHLISPGGRCRRSVLNDSLSEALIIFSRPCPVSARQRTLPCPHPVAGRIVFGPALGDRCLEHGRRAASRLVGAVSTAATLPVDSAFAYVQREALAATDATRLVVALDDSITRKTGRCIPGCGWRKDPLVHTSTSTSCQRVLQFCAAIPPPSSARLVRGLAEAPFPKTFAHADAQTLQAYVEPANKPTSTR